MARMTAPEGGCAVRMYRQGLGDCFLLAFGAARGKQKYVMIDCGVLLGTANAEANMQAVAKDIRTVTGGHLDALVITHEHWDHVSGFVQAQQEFEKLDVDQLWLAWTENPRNPLARELRERRRMALEGLRSALTRAGAAPQHFSHRIQSVSEFFGEDMGLGARATTEDALDWAKQQWKNHRYCDPGGTPLSIDGLDNVRFYVLGPPADPAYIRKSRPSSRGGQVYLDDATSGNLGLYLSALNAAPAVREPYQDERRFTPFNEAYHRKDPAHQDVQEISCRYQATDWRKIDADWTAAAGELALKLDAHTNNTSLVLAIELARDDKVLLFTGDAQVGNWLSWDDVTWSGDFKELTTGDLLERTVLYKVGHHGSHNATLREKGLERMTNGELAALIPVNRKTAKTRRWRMPHEPLYERLVEKTLGRIVMADSGLPQATSDAAIESFLQQCRETELYTELDVHPWKPVAAPAPATRKSAKKKASTTRKTATKKKTAPRKRAKKKTPAPVKKVRRRR
ncbi:MAG TPA: MBL fold metallo-hydrolase [Gammaproteobacteria bacterium]|nr:MBL fold metallo-hydrolase [Gammaproteobacteria bacterium]